MNFTGLTLAVFLMIGIPSVVMAECTWVLWAKTWGPWASHPKPWDVVAAYEKRDQCPKARRPAFESYPRSQVEYEKSRWGPPEQVESDAKNYTITLRMDARPHGPWYSTQFLCLPDTIDSREKGTK